MSLLRSKTFLLQVLCVFTFVTRCLLAFRSEEKLTEKPYNDDAYYALTVGRHIGLGNGFSIDGIHPTNGVQPLICLIYGADFYLTGGNKFDGVRASFFIFALIEVFCVWAVYRLLKVLLLTKDPDNPTPIIGAALWALLFANIMHNVNGLETGLYAALIIATLWKYGLILRSEREGASPKLIDWILLGGLLGLTVLARIDGVFLVISITAIEFFRRKNNSFPKRIVPPLLIGMCAFVISSPWWLYNYHTFGSLMPISGQSESIESYFTINLQTTPIVIGDIFLTLFYIPLKTLPYAIQLSLALAVILAAILIWKRFLLSQYISRHFETWPLIALGIVSMVFIFYYTFFFSAPHFIGRYLHPLRILLLLLWTIFLPHIYKTVRKNPQQKLGLYALSVFLLGSVVFNVAHYVYNYTTTKYSPAYKFAVYAKSHPEWKIGMTSSGTAGFILDNVVNLDGKVNYDALLARKRGELGQYAIKAGVDVIADWKGYIDILIPDAEKSGAYFKKIAQIDEIEVHQKQE